MPDLPHLLWLMVLGALVAQDTTAGPQARFCEPIVGGALAGWIVDDLQTGLLIGVTAQLLWSGAVPAGMSRFLDANTGTVAAVAISGSPSASVPPLTMAAAAFLMLVPIGYLGTWLTTVVRRTNDRLAASGRFQADSPRVIEARHLAGWLISGMRGMMTVAIGIGVGRPVLTQVATLSAPWVDPILMWSGFVGAGIGVSIGVTRRYGRGRITLVGASVAAAALLIWRLAT